MTEMQSLHIQDIPQQSTTLPSTTNNSSGSVQQESSSSSSSSPVQLGEMKLALQRQVEFYFSRQNLSHDSYLLSQMGPQMFVPISVLVQFSKVKELTEDVAMVAEALKDSKVCTLSEDGSAIRPNIKMERNTIIMREIPSETPVEQIEAIFKDCAAVTSVRSDVGDTWFVTLETEDDAVKTLLDLRSKTFQDKPIKARLKSENLVRSFYPAVLTDVNPAVVQNPVAYYHQQRSAYYNVPGQYNSSRMYQGGAGYDNQDGRFHSRGSYMGKNGGNRNSGYQQRYHNGTLSKDGRKTGNNNSIHGRKKDKKGFKGSEKRVERQPILNALNFPPLPSSGEKSSKDSRTGLFGDHFIKYAHDDIMEIVKNMSEQECQLEKGKFNFELHAAALTEEANADLLRNQRTYSIDQAREAMRQGRPIRSDSIGSIDYESMIYGEDYTREAREERAALPSKFASSKATDSENPASPVKNASVDSDRVSESPSSNKSSEPQQEPQPKKGGYAAALLNGAASTPVVAPKVTASVEKKEQKNSGASTKQHSKKSKNENMKETKEVPSDENNNVAVVSESSLVTSGDSVSSSGVWGEGKRSFLDVLKTKSEGPVVASNPVNNNNNNNNNNNSVESKQQRKKNVVNSEHTSRPFKEKTNLPKDSCRRPEGGEVGLEDSTKQEKSRSPQSEE